MHCDLVLNVMHLQGCISRYAAKFLFLTWTHFFQEAAA